jgi:hypothetical protein
MQHQVDWPLYVDEACHVTAGESKFFVRQQVGDVGFAAGEEIVQAVHLRTTRQQPFAQV